MSWQTNLQCDLRSTAGAAAEAHLHDRQIDDTAWLGCMVNIDVAKTEQEALLQDEPAAAPRLDDVTLRVHPAAFLSAVPVLHLICSLQ